MTRSVVAGTKAAIHLTTASLRCLTYNCISFPMEEWIFGGNPALSVLPKESKTENEFHLISCPESLCL